MAYSFNVTLIVYIKKVPCRPGSNSCVLSTWHFSDNQ